MRIYLAGPMRGYPEYNFPAFLAAAEQLRGRGHAVVNPAEFDLGAGFDPAVDVFESHRLPDIVRRDIYELSRCDAIALLPGWSRSVGAKAELAVARWLKLRVFFLLGNELAEAKLEAV